MILTDLIENMAKTLIFYLFIEFGISYGCNKIFIICPIYILYILYMFYMFYNSYNASEKRNVHSSNKNNDEFVLCFRKTRVETLLMSRIEDISKTRDIQFVISFFYFKNDKSIKGLIYVITSKIVYKLLFIKNNIICTEYHTFNTFISKINIVSYNYIKNFLNENKNCKEKTHHNEFYTWPYYYFTNNYNSESKDFDKFLKSL